MACAWAPLQPCLETWLGQFSGKGNTELRVLASHLLPFILAQKEKCHKGISVTHEASNVAQKIQGPSTAEETEANVGAYLVSGLVPMILWGDLKHTRRSLPSRGVLIEPTHLLTSLPPPACQQHLLKPLTLMVTKIYRWLST